MPPAWKSRPRLNTPAPSQEAPKNTGAASGSAHNATIKVEENH